MIKPSYILTAACGVIGLILTPSTINAAVISVTGDIELIDPPPSVAFHALQSPVKGYVFQEQADYQLLADTRYSIPGDVGTYDEGSDMRPGDLLAGTVVNSYLLHFDTDFGAADYQGTVEFSDPIVAVMLRPFALNESDDELGAAGTTYPQFFNERRGLDYQDPIPDDKFYIYDSRTIGFDLANSNVVDHIRVVTSAASVPEPGTVWLLSSFLVIGLIYGRFPRFSRARVHGI